MRSTTASHNDLTNSAIGVGRAYFHFWLLSPIFHPFLAETFFFPYSALKLIETKFLYCTQIRYKQIHKARPSLSFSLSPWVKVFGGVFVLSHPLRSIQFVDVENGFCCWCRCIVWFFDVYKTQRKEQMTQRERERKIWVRRSETRKWNSFVCIKFYFKCVHKSTYIEVVTAVAAPCIYILSCISYVTLAQFHRKTYCHIIYIVGRPSNVSNPIVSFYFWCWIEFLFKDCTAVDNKHAHTYIHT